MRKLLIFSAAILCICACGGVVPKPQPEPEPQPSGVTEVIYFHGKKRCVTCNAIQTQTQAVVDSLADPTVVMRVIDLSAPENAAIAEKYEVAWSSLILDRGGSVENQTAMGFRYAKSEPHVFRARLADAIRNLAK